MAWFMLKMGDMLHITAIPALADNYIWMLRGSDDRVAIVDPGEARPVKERLAQDNLELGAILITHHHPDHTNGIKKLIDEYPVPVYGPANENYPITGLSDPLDDNKSFTLEWLNLSLEAMHIPGHTLGHIALYGNGLLFCGDTLFSAGCGKLFEGTAEQMYNSLSRLRNLPADTQVYCGHEYTEKNLLFALAVEPDNSEMQTQLDKARAATDQGKPSLPSTIGLELKINPFLRCTEATVIDSAQHRAGKQLDGPVEVLATLRDWKDNFKPEARLR